MRDLFDGKALGLRFPRFCKEDMKLQWNQAIKESFPTGGILKEMEVLKPETFKQNLSTEVFD